MFPPLKFSKIYLTILAGTLLTGSWIHFMLPAWRSHIIIEDCLIENLSALFYLSATAFAIISRVKRPAFKLLQTALPLLALLAFLDELSFGQRLFNLEAPKLCGYTIDAIHDLPEVGLHQLKSFFYPHQLTAFFFLFFSASLALLLLFRFRTELLRLLRLKTYKDCYLYQTLAGFLMCIALSLDIVSTLLFPKVLEELFEMNAALAVLFCVFCADAVAATEIQNKET